MDYCSVMCYDFSKIPLRTEEDMVKHLKELTIKHELSDHGTMFA